jgi:zinc transporter, ZIP family
METIDKGPLGGSRRGLGRTLLLFSLPVILLGAVIVLFLRTNGAGLSVNSAAPAEALVFEKTVLHPGVIRLHVRNTSPQDITIAQVNVRDAFVPFSAAPGRTVPRLGRAVLDVPYPWVEGEAYSIRLFTGNSVPFDTVVEVATETRGPDSGTLLSFTLIGLYVGVVPVFLGMFWFPLLRRLGARVFIGLMALTVGLLLYLGIDAANEALESAALVGGPFQGVGLTGIGIVATFLGLQAVARLQGRAEAGETSRRVRIAFMISLGIGLHNLGEGLAIGASFSVGAAALGTFLVIGFILQNITEGLGIVAPILREKPSLRTLAGLGLLGGAPAIVGTWAGGLVYSPILSVLFLSIGAGAVFEVAWEITRLIRQDLQSARMPLTIAGGAVAGMSLLYVTGLIIK